MPSERAPATLRAMAQALAIALYVSSVEGRHVTRYGTGTLIGAEVDLTVEGNLRWNPDAVVAIPVAEFDAFGGEYSRAIAEGSLKKRTETDYTAWLKSIDDAHAKAKAEREAASAKQNEPAPAAETTTTEPAATTRRRRTDAP